jgi:DNA-binding Lrp family transcriptional regulator
MSHDYTPLPDAIAQDLGVYAACVYGRVWRYCQMEGGVCTAAVQTIADDLAISAPTVKRHLANLVGAGYLFRTGGGRDGRPNTYRQTAKWVMGGSGGRSERSTQVDQKDLPRRADPDQRDLPPQITEIQGVDQRDLGGGSERSTRDIPSSSSSEPFMPVTEEEGSRAPVRTRPAPKPETRRPTAPSPSSVIDPNDEMQAAFLEGCGLDPELTRSSVLISVADYAGRLRRRKFTAAEIREAAATWHEFLPHRDPEDLEPPHPQQLAEWVARRRASKAMASATSKARPVAQTFRVPFIER